MNKFSWVKDDEIYLDSIKGVDVEMCMTRLWFVLENLLTVTCTSLNCPSYIRTLWWGK